MKYENLTGGTIAVLMIAVLAGSGTPITDDLFFCEDTEELCEASYGVSGGKHTRCYEKESQTSEWWDAPYCSTGWLKVSEYVKSEKEIPVEPKVKVGKRKICNNTGCEDANNQD